MYVMHENLSLSSLSLSLLLRQIRFYWLQSNLDNSRVLHILKLLSPVVKVNVYGNYLVVAMRDGHITIYHLSHALLPTRGDLQLLASNRPFFAVMNTLSFAC